MKTVPKTIPDDLVEKLEHHTNEIAIHRDALREIYEGLGDVLESVDAGLQDIEVGIETLSQYL